MKFGRLKQLVMPASLLERTVIPHTHQLSSSQHAKLWTAVIRDLICIPFRRSWIISQTVFYCSSDTGTSTKLNALGGVEDGIQYSFCAGKRKGSLCWLQDHAISSVHIQARSFLSLQPALMYWFSRKLFTSFFWILAVGFLPLSYKTWMIAAYCSRLFVVTIATII